MSRELSQGGRTELRGLNINKKKAHFANKVRLCLLRRMFSFFLEPGVFSFPDAVARSGYFKNGRDADRKAAPPALKGFSPQAKR